MEKHFSKKIVGIFSIVLLIMLSNQALAYNEFDENKDISLIIDLKQEGVVLPNVKFRIYKIASVDKEGIISLEEDFKKYPIKDLDSSDWNDYALTLKSYLVKDKISALIEGETNESGIFKANLKAGLYLIVGEQTRLGDYTYKINPYLLMLPEYDQEQNDWQYELTSYPKSLKEEGDSTSKKIRKIWKDPGNEDKRPESIEVELLANEESYKIVTLSQGNNWEYTILDLDTEVDWTVSERNIKGENYRVEVKEEGDTISIENTYIGKEGHKELQKKPDLGPKELPNTGQLWWPVFLLVGGGIIFILLGFLLNKRKGSK